MTLPRVVMLVPWRPGDRRRTWCWDVARPHLERHGFEIFLGDSPLDEWARAHAVNAASKAAGKWDVAVVADTDEIIEPDALGRAIDWVENTGGGCRPHLERFNLSEAATLRFAQRGLEGLYRRDLKDTWHGGGYLVIARQAWDLVGGYDEQFVGWGYEDTAMNLSLMRESRFDRLPGRTYHLWHGSGRKPRRESVQRYERLLRDNAELVDRWLENQRGLRDGRSYV